ncbi:MAG: DMT family transporter [Plesiomonas shigelloides]
MNSYTNTRQIRCFTFPSTETLLLLVALFWGTSYGLTKSALAYTSVLIFIALRFSLTFVSVLPIVIRDFYFGLNRDWVNALPTGFILTAIFVCEVVGISLTSASKAAFLISLSMILTAFAERLINKQRMSYALIGLSLCSVFGVVLLSNQQNLTFTLNVGDYFILTAAVLRALMVTLTKRLTQGKSISTLTLTAIQSAIVASCALLSIWIIYPSTPISLPTAVSFWFTIGYLVVFCTLFAFAVQNYAVRKTSPTKVAIIMGSEPLFGAIFAFIWLQESLNYIQAFGAALILISVVTTTTLERASTQHSVD